MVYKCPHCEKKIVKYPLKDAEGKWIPLNFIKMDLRDWMLVIVIIFMTWGYQTDMAKCYDAINQPCIFCENNGCLGVEYGALMDEKIAYDLGQEMLNGTFEEQFQTAIPD